MPKLLEQARDAIRIRHYSIRTEQAYLRWMRHFILFHNKRHPAEMRRCFTLRANEAFHSTCS